jgi:hypothetical protein
LIVLVTRKNLEYGINDKVFCIGDAVMLQLVGELNMMPILVLACRMCPKNIEGTMYAMLMSTINMGKPLFNNYERKYPRSVMGCIIFDPIRSE